MPKPQWMVSELIDQKGIDSHKCHMGWVLSKVDEQPIPVAFVDSKYLQPGWREIRLVLESKARSDFALFLADSIGFLPPPAWAELIREGKILNRVFGPTPHKGAFLLEAV